MFLYIYIFYDSGKGFRSKDHSLQTRPQQAIQLEDEDIPYVLQRGGETFRHNAFHSEVTFSHFKSHFPLYSIYLFILIVAEVISGCSTSPSLLLCVFRALEDEGKARLGVVECAKHELLQPFTVLHEKESR